MSTRLTQALKKRAISWAGQLTRLAKSFAPNHVKPAISSSVEVKNDNTFIIRTTANRRIAPDARAQEFGSGLRARRGSKKKYPIEPKTKKFLAFHWEVADANANATIAGGRFSRFTFLPDGRVIFPLVMHPGIQAANGGKGYIAPAIKELKKRAKAELDKDMREVILGDLRQSFGRKR